MSKVTAAQLVDTLERRLMQRYPRCTVNAWQCHTLTGAAKVAVSVEECTLTSESCYVDGCPPDAEAVAAMEQRVIAAVTALGWK